MFEPPRILDPFDRLDRKGAPDSHPSHATIRADRTRVVDLADEFELTTASALDRCDELGIRATDGASLVSDQDADRFRSLVRERLAAAEAEPSVPDEDDSTLSLRARLDGLGNRRNGRSG